MRKLYILKSLVDFLFITTSCVVPFLILGIPAVFILSENITSDFLSLDKIQELVNSDAKLELSKESADKIEACRTYLDEKVKRTERPIYGINTGFGSLCDTEISNENLGQLQWNLVTSHACGMGDEVSQDIVKLMILLKIQGIYFESLLYNNGHSRKGEGRKVLSSTKSNI